MLDRVSTGRYRAKLERVEAAGWDVHHVRGQPELVAFARSYCDEVLE